MDSENLLPAEQNFFSMSSPNLSITMNLNFVPACSWEPEAMNFGTARYDNPCDLTHSETNQTTKTIASLLYTMFNVYEYLLLSGLAMRV